MAAQSSRSVWLDTVVAASATDGTHRIPDTSARQALRPIKAGEEITISYMDLTGLSASR